MRRSSRNNPAIEPRGRGRGSRGTQRGTAAAPAPAQPQIPPAPAAEAPPRPQVAEAPRFALTPALASRGIIDYQTRSGERLYSSATKQLEDERYDGEAYGLHQFLESLEKRSKNYGWDTGIMMIPPVIPDTMPSSLLGDYGTIDIERVRAFENTYIDTPTRSAQDTNLLYECIMNSISKEGRAKITIWKKDYMLRGFPSGNLLLKVLIRECHLDTNATSGGIRAKLSSLDTYLPKVGYDILKFNMYVKNLVIQLKARGESSNDLLTNLFKGYLAASDKAFVSYIDKKLELYEEGTEISADQLMLWARQKYDLLREKGTWNAPTEEEEKIIALEAQLKKMEKQMKSGKAKGNPKSNQNGRERRTNNKDNPRRKEKPDWFEKEPDDPTKKVTWNGKDWNWCGRSTGGKCESFVRHLPTDCKGMKKRKGDTTANRNVKVKVEAVEAEVMDEASDHGSDDDDDGYES